MNKTELICIGCPLGCCICVRTEGKEIKKITGNTCKRGEDYARKELTDPRRIVTSTVRVLGGTHPVVSVKTVSDIPKDKIADCIRQMKEIQVCAPVKIGDIIIENAAGCGVAVAATKEIKKVGSALAAEKS